MARISFSFAVGEGGLYILWRRNIEPHSYVLFPLDGGWGSKYFLPQNIKYIKRSVLTTVSQERELCVDCIYIKSHLSVSPRPHTCVFLPY